MVLCGDALEMLRTLEDGIAQTCVTSPPYWGLRDYGVNGQLGLEKTPEEYVSKLVEIFREVKRVLRRDGTLWLNLGDSYAGSGGAGGDYNEGGLKAGQPRFEGTAKQMRDVNRAKDRKTDKWSDSKCRAVGLLKPKDLVGIPWRVAFALQADGWYLRSDIIWSKPNPMPESVTDRPTKAHEYIFLLTKSSRYYYDAEAIKEPIRDSSIARLSEPNLENQEGSARGNGGKKANGKMKAVMFGGTKAAGYGTRKASGNEWNPKYAICGTGVQGHSGNTLANGKHLITANKKSVWTVTTQPRKEAHFATFPDAIPEICIKAGSKKGDIVLEPFGGSGTTAQVAKRLGRDFIIIELNPKYVKDLIEPSLANINPLFTEV